MNRAYGVSLLERNGIGPQPTWYTSLRFCLIDTGDQNTETKVDVCPIQNYHNTIGPVIHTHKHLLDVSAPAKGDVVQNLKWVAGLPKYLKQFSILLEANFFAMLQTPTDARALMDLNLHPVQNHDEEAMGDHLPYVPPPLYPFDLNLSPDENYGSQKAPREFDLNIIPQQETEEENRVDGLSLATCKLFFPS